MAFAPVYHERLPHSCKQAIKKLHAERDAKTRSTFSRSRLKGEEKVLRSISESTDIAVALSKLEEAVAVQPAFYKQIIRAAMAVYEEIRTVDRRTNREKIDILEAIKMSLEDASSLVVSETEVKWSPALSSEKISAQDRPFDQLLLGDVETRPVRVSMTKIRAGSSENVQCRGLATLSARDVGKICFALADSVSALILNIEKAEGQFFQKGYSDRRHFEAKLGSLFDREFPSSRSRKYFNARAKAVVAFARVILDLREDEQILARQFSDFRKYRTRKKKAQK